jgi:hypothetical protein
MIDTGLPYRALWRRELNAGLYGQDPQRTSTWKLDHLWLASVLQHRAEETLVMLNEAIEAGDHPDTVAHFLEQFEADCALCHRTFAEGEARAAAA